MTLDKLGALLDRLIRKSEGAAMRKALHEYLAMLGRGEYARLRALLLRWAAQGHLDAQVAAWATHSAWLDIPTVPPKDAMALLTERSLRFGQDVVARVSAHYGSGEGGRLDPRLYVRLIADVATRRGWSQGAREAGRRGGARWKVWVRVYPAKHPRDWHAALEGQTLPETDLFILPGGPNAGKRVSAPHDWDRVPDPAEWVNCGHAVIYVPHAQWKDLRR